MEGVEDSWFLPLACPLTEPIDFLSFLMNSFPFSGWPTSSVSSFSLGVGLPSGIPWQDSSLQSVVRRGIRYSLMDGILPEEPLPFKRR